MTSRTHPDWDLVWDNVTEAREYAHNCGFNTFFERQSRTVVLVDPGPQKVYVLARNDQTDQWSWREARLQ